VARHGLDAVSQIELEETLRAQIAIFFNIDPAATQKREVSQKPQSENLLSQRTGASKKGA
jgi:hypothetical protein